MFFDQTDRAPAFTIAVSDASCGLRAFVVLDDLTLGPAAGGVRTLRYANEGEALKDAKRLARAMTIKCALSGLDAGGGKTVVLDHDGLDRSRAFEVLGRRIEQLGGLFRTAGDLGTTSNDLAAMARTTQYVHADDAPLTAAVARGLLRCVEALAVHRERGPVGKLSAAIQGCGAIGGAVATALSDAGVSLLVADVDVQRAKAVAARTGARVVDAKDVLMADVDIVCPCARGGVITGEVASELRAWAVCGAANNVLEDASAEEALQARDVLFVPDVIASAGAVVDGIGKTVMGLSDRGPLIDRLGDTARDVLARAATKRRSASGIAEALAFERIAARLA